MTTLIKVFIVFVCLSNRNKQEFLNNHMQIIVLKENIHIHENLWIDKKKNAIQY